MCRIFGFRSVIPSKVHRSLLSTENSLSIQSENHPDGWGVAYYVQNHPHLIRSTQAAIDDNLFHTVSGLVSSETVVAHLRKATEGDLSVLNTHPFQFGKWVFVHNGHIPNFKEHRAAILAHVPGKFKRFILGNTDSETIFFYFLSYLSKNLDLSKSVAVDLVSLNLEKAIKNLVQILGADHENVDSTDPHRFYLTFLITNGETILSYNGGKPINFSTYKERCFERDTCSYYQETCESPDEGRSIQHLVFCSEDVKNENIWQTTKAGEWVGVDRRMNLFRK